MSDDFKLLAKLAADTTEFDSAMKRTANESKQWAAEAKQIFVSTRTPTEQYRAAVEKVSDAWRTGRIDSDTYGRAIQKLSSEFRQLQASASQAVKQTSLIGSSFKAIVGGVTAGTLAANAIRDLVRETVQAGASALRLAADFERAEVSFRTLYRSATLAKDLMAQLKSFSAETPFEFPDVKDAAVKLAGYGVSAKQQIPTLRMLGDIAAGTNSNLGELVETYGKARVSGRAYTRDVMEFANRGVPIWEALRDQFKKSTQEIKTMVEGGQIGFGELQRALLSLSEEGGRFHGSLKDQSQTIHGLTSTIKDNLNLALAEYGERLAVDLQLRKNAEATAAWTNSLKTDMAPALSLVTKDLVDFGKIAFDATNVFGHIFSAPGINNGGGALSSFHEAMVRLNLSMAKLRGDTEAEADLMNELGKIASQVDKQRFGGGPKPEEEKLKPEDMLPDTSLPDAIAKANAKLKEEIATFGKSSDEIEIWKLRQKGATDAQLEAIQAMVKQKAAMKELADETKRAAKEQENLAKRQADATKALESKLEDRLASLKKQRDDNELAQHAKQFGADSVSPRAKALAAEIKQWETLAKVQKEQADALKKDMDAAKQIIEGTQTPYEKFLKDAKEITELYKKGLLTQEQAQRAARKAENEFVNSGPEYSSENRALLRGSAEAFSAVNRVNDRKRQDEIAEDHLTVAKREEILLRRIEQNQGNIQRWN